MLGGLLLEAQRRLAEKSRESAQRQASNSGFLSIGASKTDGIWYIVFSM